MTPTSELILVTGSSGYIGTAIIKRLSPRYRVVGLDQKHPRELPSGSDFIECDLTKDESVSRALATVRERHGTRLASCIHLAAYYDFSGEPSPLYRTLTVEGTSRLLRELRQFDTDQFLFSSTLLVMKPAEEESETITEASPLEPAWDYPKSKLAAEAEIERNRGNARALILRIAGVYDEDCRSIPIAQHIARIYEKKFESVLFPGDADHGQPFIHRADLVDCVEKAVELRRALGEYEVFLIAEGDLMSYAELQDRLGELIHGKEWPTIRIPKVMAKAGAWAQQKLASNKEEAFIKPWMVDLADDHYPIAIDRARARLGWEPRHRLRDTLPEMVSRLKRDPEQWYARNGLQKAAREAPEEGARARRSGGR